MNTKGTVEQAKELADQGYTQAEAGREIGVSRQRINEIARANGISFIKKQAQLISIVCPRCGKKREVIPSAAKRKKTNFCSKCHIVALGIYKKGAEASPVTKRKPKP